MASTPPEANPFATRFIRPGALPFRFPAGLDASTLVARLAAGGWRGQIVGPHGSGKSTLVASLLQPLAEAGRRPYVIALHDGQRQVPRVQLRAARQARAGLIVVDGYEQLGAVGRAVLHASCRLRGRGLLITAHRDVGLPTLLQTLPTVELAGQIVADLLAACGHGIGPSDVARHFAAHKGNLREMLFALYDVYEARQPRTSGTTV